jgi:hypothetical protein
MINEIHDSLPHIYVQEYYVILSCLQNFCFHEHSRPTPSKTVPPPPKSGPTKKIGILKIAWPKAKPGSWGTSEIELPLAKPVGVSKKFRLLDAAASSHRLHTAGITTTHAARVRAFNNLGDDSSLDVHKTPLPAKMVEKRVSAAIDVWWIFEF